MKTIESLRFKTSCDNFYVWINSNYQPDIAIQIQKAWIFAIVYQGLDKRRDGTTVLSHLKAAAKYIQRWGFSYKYVIAALLHDLVEDSPVTLLDIQKHFGKEVSDMVDFMSKNVLEIGLDYDQKVDHWLKTRPCYIFIRLADQFHNILNYQGYRNFQSMLENCHDILKMLDRADIVIMAKPNLQNNQVLLDDLKILRSLAIKHLAD